MTYQPSGLGLSYNSNDAELDDLDDDDMIEVKPERDIKPVISDGTVHTEHAKHPVWLLKVPKFFADEFQVAFDKGGVELGKIIEHDVPKGQKRKLTFAVSDAEWTKQLPKNYNLNLTQTGPRGLYSFTVDPASKAATGITGQVVMEAIAQPVPNEKFRAFKKARMALEAASGSASSSKKIQMVSKQVAREAEAIGNMGAISRDKLAKQVAVSGELMVMFGLFCGLLMYAGVLECGSMDFDTVEITHLLYPNIKKTKLDRDEKLPKEDLRTELFGAFGEHEYWNFVGLEKKTRQPSGWLRECLSEVAKMVKYGPYHGMWTLKPEYRLSQDQQDTGIE
ncbi:hypothetical protein SmJEL517_g04353 [Synchytrium microbalum]|uniref:Transcription initiation factor IIF subunit beta n=1 Tax=Synchytrium microbalum TaxID=1806994 RepID=A0A507C4U2_9FUNG|nr:uncharacterized protein SmJEL517_g04353 [Synchytrium microbalum]TPX32553.1 hypothetical protein SmJEL517_g04353 [Synchytrium microbalum]